MTSLDSPRSTASRVGLDQRKRQIRAAEIRLLYANANIGIGVTAIAALVLGSLQWSVISHSLVLGWSLYMLVVTAARSGLAYRYSRTHPVVERADWWGSAFTVGVGLTAAGWGAAGILLYPVDLAHQVLLIFVLGGMMLGGASLLAPRSGAFLAFLLPTGLVLAARLVFQGDQGHLAMGFLAAVFTIAIAATTSRIHQTIDSSLNLRFENQDLVEDLKIANDQAEELNQQLESRVRERTAQLQRSAERLQAEIEQREQVEEELLRARKLEALGVLAGGIAHDFNNLLTVIQGNVELAKLRLDQDNPLQEVLGRTTSACQRAALLSSQLLTFAKGGDPIRRVVSVAKLLQDAVDLARAGAPTSIDVDIPNDLRPVEVDAGQMSQVIYNILLNAKQAMPDSGIIEVRAANVVVTPAEGTGSNAYVRISIRDYGCGISADVLPRIFDPYFTTKPSGTGLGLATAYSVVSKHSGHISVESEPGLGTVFTVDLPCSRESPEVGIPVSEGLRRGTGRLLVMDDEEALRKLLKSTLTNLGYEVQTARDGAETIVLYEAAKAAGCGFDAVLLDLTVRSGMGGVEASARLKELDPSARLIVSSGYSHAPVMSDFRKYGFDGVIPKPWTPAQLSEVFRVVIATQPDRKPNQDS